MLNGKCFASEVSFNLEDLIGSRRAFRILFWIQSIMQMPEVSNQLGTKNLVRSKISTTEVGDKVDVNQEIQFFSCWSQNNHPYSSYISY